MNYDTRARARQARFDGKRSTQFHSPCSHVPDAITRALGGHRLRHIAVVNDLDAQAGHAHDEPHADDRRLSMTADVGECFLGEQIDGDARLRARRPGSAGSFNETQKRAQTSALVRERLTESTPTWRLTGNVSNIERQGASDDRRVGPPNDAVAPQQR